MAEELGLEQRLGQRAAVDRDERRSLRGELKWIARATSSLPVPDSPVISTVLLVGAIVSISWNTASIASLRPMMFENWCELCRARA